MLLNGSDTIAGNESLIYPSIVPERVKDFVDGPFQGVFPGESCTIDTRIREPVWGRVLAS
jgi:hypothetical protein